MTRATATAPRCGACGVDKIQEIWTGAGANRIAVIRCAGCGEHTQIPWDEYRGLRAEALELGTGGETR